MGKTFNKRRAQYSFIYLLIGFIFLFFFNGRWILPIAAFVAPIFLIRFLRFQKPMKGFLIIVLVGWVSNIFVWKGMLPMSGFFYYLVSFMMSVFTSLTFLLDRIYTQKFKGIVSTLIFPAVYVIMDYINILANPSGSYGTLIHTQSSLPLLQLVSITGIWGVIFLITWTASIINWLWDNHFEKNKVYSAFWSVTSYSYGAFNRVQEVVTPGDIKSVSNLYWSEGHQDAPEGSLYLSWGQSSGQAEGYTFFDAAGRTLRSVSFGFDEEKTFVDYQYDAQGRKYKVSLPYYDGDSALWSIISYDVFGRVDEVLAADNTKTEYDYSALMKEITVSKGSYTSTSELHFNALGETVQSKDASGTSVYMAYYPDGKLKESYTSVNPGLKTEVSYDSQGNRVCLKDPDAGKDSTVYDSFGQLILSISPKGDTSEFDYDKLGRIISMNDSRGQTNYVYISDTTSKAFGMTDSIYMADGSLSEVFVYENEYGRLIEHHRRIPDKQFSNTFSYDWYGRLLNRTYPSGFELTYSYTDIGLLDEISGDGKSIWSCNDVNELGQITSYSQGDYITTMDFDPFGRLEEQTTGSVFNMRYGFDDAGNIEFREDVRTSQKEEFSYDNLNRLTGIEYYLNGTHITAEDFSIGYSNDGNISSKTDVATIINYGENGTGPHALSSVEEPVSTFRATPQAIEYTCFNKVSEICDTIAQDTTLRLEFTYGLQHQRVKMIKKRNGIVEQIKYYNGDYEEDSTSTGTKKYHYISAPNGLTAIFVSEGSADTLYHVLTDHLGSLTGIINEGNDSVQYFSYSAWGVPRDADNWTDAFEGDLFCGRGFTSHEHLPEFNLINMNGRVYDPVLARFLSVDPFVQFPGLADGYNRYSYVMNNPLRFVDPTGYLTQDEFYAMIDDLLNSEDGGFWSEETGTYYFSSGGEAYRFGQSYINYYSGRGLSTRTTYQISFHGLPFIFGRNVLAHHSYLWIKFNPNFNIEIVQQESKIDFSDQYWFQSLESLTGDIKRGESIEEHIDFNTIQEEMFKKDTNPWGDNEYRGRFSSGSKRYKVFLCDPSESTKEYVYKSNSYDYTRLSFGDGTSMVIYNKNYDKSKIPKLVAKPSDPNPHKQYPYSIELTFQVWNLAQTAQTPVNLIQIGFNSYDSFMYFLNNYYH